MRIVRDRSAALAIVVFAALAQYLPWVTVRRVIFLYHYLPVVPFLAIALGWFLFVGLRGYRYQRVVAIGAGVGAVAFFLAVLPMLEGWSVSVRYLDTIRNIFPWVIK